MSNKIALLLFTTAVLLASFAAMTIPQANALINSRYDNSHVTARFEGDLKVCGNHLCAHGEKTSWDKAVWGAQSIGHGKVGTSSHGEDVMHKMSGSTSPSTTSHGSVKPMQGTMATTAAGNGNMTGNMPTGTK